MNIEKLNDLARRYRRQHIRIGGCGSALCCYCWNSALNITGEIHYYPNGTYGETDPCFEISFKSKNWLERLFGCRDYQFIKLYEVNQDLKDIIIKQLPGIEKKIVGWEEEEIREKQECLNRAEKKLKQINEKLNANKGQVEQS